MLPFKIGKPIKIGDSSSRSINAEMVELFFSVFAPEEIKYKVAFALMCCTGLRISEVCNIELKDFVPNTRMTELWVNIAKKKTHNQISKRIIPEACASLVRAYIRKYYPYIMDYGNGFIFPKPNRGHISPTNVRDFLAKKRKLLASLYPDKGFNEVIGNAQYDHKVFGKEGKGSHPLYRFTCHSFRHFYAMHISKSPETASQILRHENPKTTARYRKEHNLYAVETQLTNELFNKDFHEVIAKENDGAVAIWENLKNNS